ncbi:17kDa alpha-amylase/trypsin inhibitor 1-like [Lolium rigidum]|uniref:17kDa alpha-amylase/trypsin inhibitor 1-like n=1 Tax=Lolium rigidum TaxID=89674 RepID=UPI001F5E0FC0|nr:17kDa alpha-amylase/trypsin inhibitor 1-like [Lolium rigidum]
MASKQLILTAVLLIVLAVISVAVEADYDEYCRVGKSIPYNPLPGCREYITRRCGARGGQLVSDQLKQRCCRELSNLPQNCRCDALSILAHGVITEEGVTVSGMQAVPGCDRERIPFMASSLTAYRECNLQNPVGPGMDCVLFRGGIS